MWPIFPFIPCYFNKFWIHPLQKYLLLSLFYNLLTRWGIVSQTQRPLATERGCRPVLLHRCLCFSQTVLEPTLVTALCVQSTVTTLTFLSAGSCPVFISFPVCNPVWVSPCVAWFFFCVCVTPGTMNTKVQKIEQIIGQLRENFRCPIW